MHVPGTSGEFVGDVFAKSEKWLGTPPVPDVAKWTSREAEILGWQSYINDLTAWAMQASLEFGSEIEHACRWPDALQWGNLTVAQRARSRRLLAILRSAFGSHPRTLTLINAFSEGINLSNADVAVNPELQASNGFELVRQLTLEYSIRTRSEALSFRTALAGKSFTLHGNETSASTVVTDTIRKIDFEMARYSKLLGTLSSKIDATGLHVAEADLVAVLLRSLPDAVRTFCLHHTGGETYQAFRTTALRWEQQQRAFAEFHPRRNLYQVEASGEKAAHYDMSASDGDGNWNLDAVGGVKCGACGSRKHGTHACDVDLSKLKCFKCSKYGHISANCPERKKGKGDNKQVIKGKGKQKGKKGKGKAKGFGKKGKMNEVGYENDYDGTDMWWQEDGSWWEDPTWFETAQVWDNSWDSSWDTAWTDNNGDAWNESWSWPVEDGQNDTGTGEATPAVQSLVLSPLISDVFCAFSTGLTVSMLHETTETETETVACSHLPFSTLDTVLHDGVEPELIFVSDSESVCSLVIDHALGDELDGSDSEEETQTYHLWDLNFGWMPESTSGSDSALLCGMLNTGRCEPQSADNSSSSTAKQTLHEPPFFGEHFLGLQGPGHWGAVDAAGAECSEGLLSTWVKEFTCNGLKRQRF
eukprot:s2980_g10.t1